MRANANPHVALVFAQILAAASVGCGQIAPLPNEPPAPDGGPAADANGPSDSGADAGTDAPVIGCGGCGCGSPFYEIVDGGVGADAALDCFTLCRDPQTGASANFCTLVDASVPALVQCTPVCLGRRPEGLRGGPAARTCSLGAYFAAMAQLEAASVPAFRRLARELSGFGAPTRLVRAAERAAREEIRHARSARALARRHGAIDASFEASPHIARSLEALAIENAGEGCVREAYGALVAMWQAREAWDPRVRAHFARIARDETRHAALAFRIDAWALPRLDRAARARVAAARAAARADLRVAIEREVTDATVARVAGVPRASVALALAAQLEVRTV